MLIVDGLGSAHFHVKMKGKRRGNLSNVQLVERKHGKLRGLCGIPKVVSFSAGKLVRPFGGISIIQDRGILVGGTELRLIEKFYGQTINRRYVHCAKNLIQECSRLTIGIKIEAIIPYATLYGSVLTVID